MAQTPAQFLVESLVADALLLGEWGAQEPLQLSEAHGSEPNELPAEPLSKADIRRKQNRERTKQTRESQRENIERMKVTVQTLTQQLDLLLRTQRTEQDDSSTSESTKKYAVLTETEHQLKAEKLLLRSKLVQHQNLQQRLMDVFATDKDSVKLESEALAPNLADIAASFPEFRAISLERANAAIDTGYRSILECEPSAQPLAPWAIGSVNAPSHTFGWSLSCALRPGSFFYFAMTKKLDGVSAQQAMQRSWSVMSRPHVADESPSQRLAQSMLLQRLDSHTSVIGNDWHHPLRPGVRMRSISVRQRRAVNKGYDVVLGTLDPQEPEQRRNALPGVEYLRASNWHSFADEDDGSGCVAALKILWRYDTRENLHVRLVNALTTTWRWESGVSQNWKLLKH